MLLGLYAQDVTGDMTDLIGAKEGQGVIIAEIMKDSPADNAGLKPHDIILEMDGKKTETYDTFRNDVAMLTPGTKTHLLIQRDGKKQEITVTIDERPTSVAQAEPSQESKEQQGLHAQNLTQELAQQLGYTLGEGVIVTAVVPGSPASAAGIESGDLILSVNQKQVNSIVDFDQALKQAQKDKKAMLLIKHGAYSRFVLIQF